MMKQWAECKKEAKDALVLFRMGDFYEAFEEDAQRLASALDINLTKRCEIPMAGVPVVSLDSTLTCLAEKGIKIALVEQLKDPKEVKGIVPRGIVRVITPGSFEPEAEQTQSRYLVCLAKSESKIALMKGDLSTGKWSLSTESYPKQSALHNLSSTLYQLKPAEIVLTASFQKQEPDWIEELTQTLHCTVTTISDSYEQPSVCESCILNALEIHSLDSLGISTDTACILALGSWIHYVTKELRCDISHFGRLQFINSKETMLLDRITLRNLEVTDPLYHDLSQKKKAQSTLLHSLDLTKTAPGARLLREWLLAPLKSIKPLRMRQEAVAQWMEHSESLRQTRSLLSNMRDLERLSAKITLSKISPPEVVQLYTTLEKLPQILEQITPLDLGYWPLLRKEVTALPELTAFLKSAILVDKVPARAGEGDFFMAGYHRELDEWRTIRDESHSWLLSYQSKLKEELDIKTLKVGYTPAFGYYIEVSKGQAHRVPDTFRRRQTLVNAERFVSSELKEFEEKVLGAKDKISEIERVLFQDLIAKLQQCTKQISRIGKGLAVMDVLASFAQKALSHHYCKPSLLPEGNILEITKGRHPIVEEQIGRENFIANNTAFQEGSCQIALITGPNMAGKSTYIRQVAVLTLMAQIGSFVPAQSMRLSLCDRIFTRVGASDDLARGQSTFMVEMTEAANILNHATNHSLVILDEVGRGTSTRDGLAIAQAIIEHLLTDLICRPKTLFATHYWELTALQKHFPRQLRNFHVRVKEQKSKITFLHCIEEGSCDKSYGVHVAQLAGLPSSVVERAHLLSSSPAPRQMQQQTPCILEKDSSFDAGQALLKKLKEIDPQAITPIEALVHLQKLKEAIGRQ